MSVVVRFWETFLFPKMERILKEFDSDMPNLTKYLSNVGGRSDDYWIIAGAILGGVGIVAALLFVSSTFRWYFPGFARLYRRHVQGRFLQMLGVLLNAGTPAPRAMALLAESGYFAPVVRRRLLYVETRLEQGEPLAESLRRGRLLPAALAPLVKAAERMHNLPWALAELGEALIDRTIRTMRRISQFILPVCVVTLGVGVGFIVLGMLMPLIVVLTRLTE